MKIKTVRTFRTLQQRHWLMLGALFLALIFTGYHAFRAANGVLYWKIDTSTQIRGWMSVPYIAHRNGVPISVLNQAIDLPAEARDKRPLAKIARDQKRPVQELESKLNDAIVTHRGSNPLQEEDDQ